MNSTDQGLLERLRHEGAQVAWTEFFHLYGSPILHYGRRLGLRHEEAKDVLQATLAELVRVMPTFEYQPERGRFRGFLFTIVHRQACAHWRRERRRPETVAAPVEIVDPSTDQEVEQRWRESLLDAAIDDLRRSPGVSARDLAVFVAYAVEGVSAEEVAARYGISVNNLYQIKNRLLRRLQARADWLWRYLG